MRLFRVTAEQNHTSTRMYTQKHCIIFRLHNAVDDDVSPVRSDDIAERERKKKECERIFIKKRLGLRQLEKIKMNSFCCCNISPR